MAGILLDKPRVISARTHAFIDYIHVGANLIAAVAFRKRNKRASTAALALGMAVLGNSLMTDYPLGVFRLYSFKVHGILDYGVAAMSTVMPSLLGFAELPEAAYFRAQGAGEAVIAVVSDYSDPAGSQRRWELYGMETRGRTAA